MNQKHKSLEAVRERERESYSLNQKRKMQFLNSHTLMKEKRGVTLIALVVTIVILIVLAAVSINMIIGDNGIITQANRAVITTENADVYDTLLLKLTDIEIDNAIGINKRNALDYLSENDYIDSENIVDVEKATGVSKTTGKGNKASGDVYVVEEGENDEYYLIYYDKSNISNNLGLLFNLNTTSSTIEGIFDIDEDGIISIKSEYSYYVYGEGTTIRDTEGNEITELIIPSKINGKTVKGISDRCFKYGTSLTNVTIPSTVTTIGNYAFECCYSLTNITIPSSVITIGEGAFSECGNLSNITIPSSVITIEYGTFFNCVSLSNITIPNSVTSIGSCAFECCSSLTNITIPNSVTSIGNVAFGSCNNLSSITIPNSVTSIGNEAFEGCRSLTNITIPNSVTSIGSRAFGSCSSLNNITIPSSVTKMGDYAFGYWESIQAINCEATEKPIEWSSYWDYYSYETKRKAQLNWGV